MTYKVLALGYSQTGQLTNILDSVLGPLDAKGEIEITRVGIEPATPYPFPWPVWRFFDTFPETVYEVPIPFKLVWPDDTTQAETDFDLVILAYQVWFLSPSPPVSSFLQSEDAEHLLKGKRVITIIGCRNMWLMAQESMKQHLTRLGATLIDNIVLTDSAHSAFTFLSTPIWMLTGNRGPWLGGTIPRAGVIEDDISDAARFGHAIAARLLTGDRTDTSPMLTSLGAVRISEQLIGSEKVGKRSFRLWGRFLRALGRPGTLLRGVGLAIYVVFLGALIIFVVPVLALLKRLFARFSAAKIAREKAYYAEPSGEAFVHEHEL